jgi:plasmid replication initiation protein
MLADKNIIKYRTELINSKMKLTENELDMLYILSAQIDKNDTNFNLITFSIGELEKKTNKSWNDTRVKNSLKSLNTKPLEIIKGKNWEVYYWLSSIKYRDGIITVRFNEELKPFLLELKGRFEQVSLKNTLAIGSTYGKRIYIMLKEYEKIGHRKFNLEELQNILQVPKSFLVYKDFRVKVLEIAIREINKNTDLDIWYEETGKIRKKVVEITFFMRKNILDFKSFKESIQDLYPNEPLCYYKNRLIKCSNGKLAESGKALLYFADTSDFVDTDTATKIWELMFNHKRHLLCFQNENDIDIKKVSF